MKIQLNHITKDFISKQHRVKALEAINLSVEDGEFVCLVGPSGCGKSTLLNIIAGLDQPTQGSVQSNGKEIVSPGMDRVVMFQEAALYPWLNVLHNVEFGMAVNGVAGGERRVRARQLLRLMHLSRFERSYLHQLSGGMKQRVALARALALNPEVLLMDEPFAALDAQTRELLYEELQEIWANTKKTIVFVTHNVREAVCLGSRVLVFSARPGRIKKEFHIDLSRPRDINSTEVTDYARLIGEELRTEVEKVAKEEMDHDFTLPKTDLLRPAPGTLGDGI